jgi:hypothetical protein
MIIDLNLPGTKYTESPIRTLFSFSTFEQLSGLKINFEKNEILSIGGDNDVNRTFADIFNCQIGLFPVKCLGVPISAKRLSD